MKNNIKAALEEAGRTNKWLAINIRVHPNTISRWCKNTQQPSSKHLMAIALVLGINIHITTLIKQED